MVTLLATLVFLIYLLVKHRIWKHGFSLQERDMLSKLIQQQLVHAQQRMKHQADKNRSEREFATGDMVYIKLQPYIQSSIAPRNNQKLAYQFFGPFRVLAARVGAVAC